MKRRPSVFKQLVQGFLIFVLGGYAAAVWYAPHLIARTLQEQSQGSLVVGQAWVRFPFTLILSNLRIDPSESLFVCRAAVIQPWWVSWRSRTMWLKSVELEEPTLRLRRTQDGTWLFPSVAQGDSPNAPLRGVAGHGWRLVVETVNVLDGTVELIDEKLPKPFRGALRSFSFEGGAVTLPMQAEGIDFAIRAELVGDRGFAAPSYCSGWINPVAKNLQISCRIEPIQLSAFEPYYARERSPLQVRVYNATLQATSAFTSKDNALAGRIQLTVGNLSEADLSVLGRTVVDAKELPQTTNRELRGEIKITGPFDDPKQWRLEFVPGNEIVQRLLEPLLERRREQIPIKLGDQTVTVGIAPATEEVMTSVEEGSRQVEETLKILSSPASVEATSPEATPPAAEASPAAEAAASASVPATPPTEKAPPTTPEIKPEPPPAAPASQDQAAPPSSGSSVQPPPASPKPEPAPQPAKPQSPQTP